MATPEREPIIDATKAPRHSRRAVLIGVPVGLAAISSLGLVGLRACREDGFSTVELVEKHPELADIVSYRTSLGLSPLPPEVKDRLYDKTTDWKIPDARFENKLPQAFTSYGMASEHVQRFAFGKQSGRMVNSIQLDELKTGGAYFIDFSDRKWLISPRIDSLGMGDFLDLALHEAIGHGSDPEGFKDIYPTDTLFKVSRGKWRMLSQAFKVEGQFFHHPKDMMLPQAEKKIGLQFARDYRKGDIDKMFASDAESFEALKIFSEVAREKGVLPEDFKFNKEACRKIGRSLLADITSGKLATGEAVSSWSEPIMEDSLKEIYAEMIRMAILYPEMIGDNPEILACATEILSAIREENVDLGLLRNRIVDLPEDILKRREKEKSLGAIEGPIAPTEGPFIPGVHRGAYPESDEIKAQRARQFQLDLDFSRFVESGSLPSTVARGTLIASKCSEYGFFRSEIEYRYKLKGISVSRLDFTFDPNLDVWEIEDIEAAADSGYIKKLLIDLHEDQGRINQDEIERRTEVLQRFVGSQAFGS